MVGKVSFHNVIVCIENSKIVLLGACSTIEDRLKILKETNHVQEVQGMVDP